MADPQPCAFADQAVLANKYSLVMGLPWGVRTGW